MSNQARRKRDRIKELQKQVTIATMALERIKAGSRDPEGVASAALDAMWVIGPKQQLQGLVGHPMIEERT